MMHVLATSVYNYFSEHNQGSKFGWSCGPSLPELLADHQIVLCGGPVVYWKLLTINLDKIFKICTDTFYDQCHICFNTIDLLQGIFKCLVR